MRQSEGTTLAGSQASTPLQAPSMAVGEPNCNADVSGVYSRSSSNAEGTNNEVHPNPRGEEGSSFCPTCIHTSIEPTCYPDFEISVYTNIGGRKYQEDRMTFCPSLLPGRNDFAFFGVFDGTVGDFAADNVKNLVVPHLTRSAPWRRIMELVEHDQPISEEVHFKLPELLEGAIQQMYQNADKELVEMCASHNKDYSSSTSVTAVLGGKFLAIGHLGDSRIVLGFNENGISSGEYLTVDHKPDTPMEAQRIKSSGGSVEYLQNHHNKPFIRGGDFTNRKKMGEQPMQLQYSRAFGGKDLKMYGLSCLPDTKVILLQPHMRCMILGSDGLWDMLSADTAVGVALDAKMQGVNPAEALVVRTLEEVRIRGQSADNVTAIAVMFR